MQSVRKRARELGEIETPIVLTNTLSVPRAAEAVLDWVWRFREMKRQPPSIQW